MSKSRNVRSKYQSVPAYVRESVTERDSSPTLRTRDSRGRDKQALRATLVAIRKGGE